MTETGEVPPPLRRSRYLCGLSLGALAFLFAIVAGPPSPEAVIEAPDLNFHRALSAVADGRSDWARVYFQADLDRHPGRVESMRGLGLAWASGHGGAWSPALRWLERSLEFRPDDPVVARRLLEGSVALGVAPPALASLEGRDPEVLVLLGRGVLDSDPERAERHFAEALGMAPELAVAARSLSVLKERRGDLAGAIELARRATATDPLDRGTWARLAAMLERSGQTAEAAMARRRFELANRLSPRAGAAQVSPVEELALLAELAPASRAQPVLRRRVAASLRVGRREQGLEELEWARADLSTADRLALGRTLHALGEQDAARRLFEEARAGDRTSTRALTSLADFEAAVGRPGRAREVLLAAEEEHGMIAGFQAALARLDLHEGDKMRAIERGRRALELAPWREDLRSWLGRISSRKMAPDVEPARVSSAAAVVVASPAVAGSPGGWFREESARVGIDFVHADGRAGAKLYRETTASGVAWLDHDGDGDLDLYVLSGGLAGEDDPRAAANALFRNDGGRFVDVSAESGTADLGFGQGVCVSDLDGDGRVDLLVMNTGQDRAYRNEGEGRFIDVAARIGLGDERPSAACASGDVDGDGDLDLYVTRYVDAPDREPRCGDPARELWHYCRPDAFPGLPDSLFINDGAGRFVDEAASRGVNRGRDDRGLGVTMSDLDGDGDLDIYVANDGTANRLYVNDGTGHFEDRGPESGVAVNWLGESEAGMGVAIGDVDGDGLVEIFCTNYSLETNTLYRGLGGLIWKDATVGTELGRPSLRQVGWGTVFFDADNDGDLDLAVANGHISHDIEVFEPELRSRQVNGLWFNDGAGGFSDVSGEAGRDWSEPSNSRGLAVGDWNDDGRLDLVVTDSGGRIRLMTNRIESLNRWLGLRLIDVDGGPAIGARVRVRAGGLEIHREVRSGGSYFSQSDLRLHFGLGPHPGPVNIQIRWPDGAEQEETLEEMDAYRSIVRREGS